MERRSKNFREKMIDILRVSIHLNAISENAIFCFVACAHFVFKIVFHARACCFLLPVWLVPRIIGFIYWFPYLNNVAQLLCSHTWWLHLNSSSIIGTGCNGIESNCRIAYSMGILLMHCYLFSAALIVMSVSLDIKYI